MTPDVDTSSTVDEDAPPAAECAPGLEPGRTRLGTGVALVAAGCGLAGSLLLDDVPLGINLLIWVAISCALVVAFVQRTGIRPVGPDRRWLIVPALLVAAFPALRDSDLLQRLDVWAIVVLGMLAVVRTRSGTLVVASIGEYLGGIASAVLHALFGAVILYATDVDYSLRRASRGPAVDVDGEPTPPRQRHTGAALRGVLIALPLLLIFGALFASADAAFNDIWGDLLDWDLGLGDLPRTLWIALLVSWPIAGLLHAWMLDSDGEPSVMPAPLRRSWMGRVELAIVLGALNALFALFVALQAKYLFGGHDRVQETTGLTYAEYARSGFGQLVAVAVLVLLVLLTLDHVRRRGAEGRDKTFMSLGGVLLLLTGVVMTSAVQRLRIYEQAYGLTEDRLLAFFLLGWVAAVLVWFAWCVARRHDDRFVFGALVASVGVLIAFNAINPNRLIARSNLGRDSIDVRYLRELGADAVPVTINRFNRLPRRAQGDVARHLLEDWGGGDDGFRGWNTSRTRARDAVDEHRAKLRAARTDAPGRSGDSPDQAPEKLRGGASSIR